MENRWSDRRDLHLDVDILSAGNKLTSCYSQDIGLGGTRLYIEDPIQLSKDQDLELVFHVPQGSYGGTKYSIHGKVVWIKGKGVGLKFHDFNTSVFRSLQRLINYREEKVS